MRKIIIGESSDAELTIVTKIIRTTRRSRTFHISLCCAFDGTIFRVGNRTAMIPIHMQRLSAFLMTIYSGMTKLFACTIKAAIFIAFNSFAAGRKSHAQQSSCKSDYIFAFLSAVLDPSSRISSSAVAQQNAERA